MFGKALLLVRKYELFLLFLFCGIILALASLGASSVNINETHMLDLSKSLLTGRLNLLEPLDKSVVAAGDITYYHGKYYNYFGFLPSILLIPFILLFHVRSQWILIPPICAISLVSLYFICRYLGLDKIKSIWITFAFSFGTIYLFLALINISAYYIQIVGISFLIIALYFFICKRNYFLTSIFFCFAFLSRQTLLVAGFFFILEIILEGKNRSSVFKNLLIFLAPVVWSAGLLSIYNYARFGSIFNNGYAYNVTAYQYDLYKTALANGLFSIKHIPGNFYFMVIRGLDPIRSNADNFILKFPFFRANYQGLSIFFTSPFFVYAFLARLKDKFVFSSLITSILLCIQVLAFYASGQWQYGYRYALDFYPFIFLILISVFKKNFDTKTKAILVYSILFNAFFMYSIWGIYPLLPNILRM